MSNRSDQGGQKLCPICRKPAAAARYAPFCSQRCADLDLGRWLKGGYAIPGPAAEEGEDGIPKPAEVPEND